MNTQTTAQTTARTPNPQDLRTLQTMAQRGDLSPRAAAQLRAAMCAGADTYPYYSAGYFSVGGHANVWADGRRYTAAEYNARAEQPQHDTKSGA